MDWRINMRTIIPYPMNNGVNLCSNWTFKIIVRGLCPRSIGLQPLRQRLLIMKATTLSRWRVRRRRELVSYKSENSIGKRHPIITKSSATEFCERSQECLSASVNSIVPRNDSVKGPTNHTPRIDWDQPYVTGLMPWSVIRKLRIIGKGSWNILRNKTRCYIVWIRNLVHAVNSRRSRQIYPRRAVTLSEIAIVVIQIQICPSLVTVSEKN